MAPHSPLDLSPKANSLLSLSIQGRLMGRHVVSHLAVCMNNTNDSSFIERWPESYRTSWIKTNPVGGSARVRSCWHHAVRTSSGKTASVLLVCTPWYKTTQHHIYQVGCIFRLLWYPIGKQQARWFTSGRQAKWVVLYYICQLAHVISRPTPYNLAVCDQKLTIEALVHFEVASQLCAIWNMVW